MAENRLVGSLVLRTYDIAPNTNTLSTITAGPTYVDLDNPLGSSFANGAYIVWKNVNIRTCIGELYSKYNKFNLKMQVLKEDIILQRFQRLLQMLIL